MTPSGTWEARMRARRMLIARLGWIGACAAPVLVLATSGASPVAASPAHAAGPVQHTWRTIASGGVTPGPDASIGGGMALVGTIGQHAPTAPGAIAGPAGPGQIMLTGGFWAAVGDIPSRRCPADIGGDGVVDGADLGALLSNWGGAGEGDIDGNGVVDGADLGSLLGAWGPCG